jgi:hypothetical protein
VTEDGGVPEGGVAKVQAPPCPFLDLPAKEQKGTPHPRCAEKKGRDFLVVITVKRS